MIDDAGTVPSGSELSADLCVIGCGAAGATIAHELAGSSLRVIVLESGGLEFEAATNDLDAGDIVGLPYFPLDTARLRYFGGSTNHWGGVCRPLQPIDFEARPWIPGSGWPISRADLDPYYAQAARTAGLKLADWDLARWSAKDPFPAFPLESPIETVVAEVVDHDGRSFGSRFRKVIDAASNVTVHLHANATSIDTDRTGGHVRRIRVATLAGNHFTVTARRYVLATGGIENARLLLASNGVRPNGVGNDHDLVGRYFQEHPRFQAGVLVPADSGLRVGFYDYHVVDDQTLLGYLSIDDERNRAEGLADVQIRLSAIYDPAIQAAVTSDDADAARDLADRITDLKSDRDPIGDIGRDLVSISGDLITWQRNVIPGGPLAVPQPDVVDEVVRQVSSGGFAAALPIVAGDLATVGFGQLAGGLPIVGATLSTRIEQAPNPHSRVTLGPERDALGMRRAQLDWRLTELERHSAVRAMELLAGELGRTGLGRVRIDVEDGTASWPSDLAGGWHHMGTTRMHDDPRRGVVDKHLLVHGMDNLYVLGSSVFTTAGSGTPTITVVALTLRLLDRLRGELS